MGTSPRAPRHRRPALHPEDVAADGPAGSDGLPQLTVTFPGVRLAGAR